MVSKARHDYVELPYMYGGALIIILFLMLVAVPIRNVGIGVVIPYDKNQAESAFYTPEAFKGVSVQAKAYVVYDIVDKKVIASKNEDEIVPLASITKLMTAVTALTHYERDRKITIRNESVEDGYDLGLKPGQVWDLEELLKYTLVFSSNDGAHAIADNLGGRKAFVDEMNTDSALMGLSLRFTDSAGLDEHGEIGGSGTAIDAAKLFTLARKKFPEILDATTKTRLSVTANKERVTGIPNTNQEIENFFGAEASKTGFTDSAGGNLGVVVDVSLGHPVAIVVLGSSREGRFTDVEELYKALIISMQK